MTEKLTVGQFVTSTLDAARRRVAKTRNSAGFVGIYSEAARAVVLEYPELTAEQKQIVFESLKDDAEVTRVRTGLDSTAGLQEASRILGLPISKASLGGK